MARRHHLPDRPKKADQSHAQKNTKKIGKDRSMIWLKKVTVPKRCRNLTHVFFSGSLIAPVLGELVTTLFARMTEGLVSIIAG
jgi:hypothetical protein